MPPATPLFAGPIVHSATAHDAEHVGDAIPPHRLLPGERIDPAVGQCRRHYPEIPAGHRDRTLLEIQLHCAVGMTREDIEIAQHVSDRPIAMPRSAFTLIDRFIDLEFTPCKSGKALEDSPHSRAQHRSRDEPRSGDGTGIDHGIQRAPRAGLETDGVKGVAGGIDPDFGDDVRETVVFQGETIDEGLGDRLDRERDVSVADLINLPARCDKTDAEPIGIRRCELGNVAGDLSLIHPLQLLMQGFEKFNDGGFHGISLRRAR